MYGSRAATLLVLISDDVINRILKLDIQTNILVYVTRCCTDLTSKVLKERIFGQSSALLLREDDFFTFPYISLCKICDPGRGHFCARDLILTNTVEIH